MRRFAAILVLTLSSHVFGDEVIWPPPHLPADIPPEEFPVSRFSLSAFQDDLNQARSHAVDLIFDGDVAVNGWVSSSPNGDLFKQRNPHLVRQEFGGLRFEGVQNLAWRLHHGELTGLHPKLVVITIGLNNLIKREKPEDVAAGIRLVLDLYRQKCPDAHLVLMGILPFLTEDNSPEDRMPLLASIQKTNELIAKFADGENITYLNINDKLVRPNGVLLDANLDQYPLGFYDIWTEALQPLIDRYCPDAQASDPTPFATPISDSEPTLTFPVVRTPPPGVSPALFPIFNCGGSCWLDAWDANLAKLKGGPCDIVVDGGVNTEALSYDATLAAFLPHKMINLGIWGDSPANMMWRVAHGDLAGMDPSLVVLMPEANQHTPDRSDVGAKATVSAIGKMVDIYQKACPHAHIVVCNVAPLGKPDELLRKYTDAVNQLLSQAWSDDRVTYLDLSDEMVESDGSPRLSLEGEGVQAWVKAIRPLVAKYCPRLK